jgi:hypothetical protein
MDKEINIKNKELIVEQLKKTPIIQVVCEKLNVPRSSFYRWRKDDKDFSQKVDEALFIGKHLVNDLAESQLISAIKDRNMTAIIFWLKNHHKNYANKLELSGRIRTETKLTPEQEEEIKRALKLASLYKEEDKDNN